MFPIITGERNRSVPLGFAADFCESCLSITPHLVSSRVITVHVYYFPIANREVERESVCDVCGNRSLRPASFANFVRRSHGRQLEIEPLLAATNPNLLRSADPLLDVLERFDSAVARQGHVAYQFLASQERFITRWLSRKPMLVVAAMSVGLGLTMLFWLSGHFPGAMACSILILILPAAAILWVHGIIAATVAGRLKRLLSGSATRWETLEGLIRTKAVRFPLSAWLFGKPRFEALRNRKTYQRADGASTSTKEYISLADFD